MTNSDRARALISEHLGLPVTACDDDASFVSDLGTDSLDRYELAGLLETEFGIEIPDDTVADFDTVGDVVRYVGKYVPEAV